MPTHSLEECLLPVLRPSVCLSVSTSVSPSVRLFACIGRAPTGQISVSFNIQDFHENLSTQPDLI